MSNTERVNDFVSCWNRMDVEAIMDFFTEESVYTNIPIDPPNQGLEAIRNTITGFVAMATQIEFIVHNQAESDTGVVINERTDRFLINDNWVEIPVMGVFEFRDDKLIAWRDYFDMAPLSQLGG